jgi:serpin B
MISNRPLVNVLGAVLLLSACSSPAEPQEVQPIESLPRQLTADERALADAGEAFAFDFLGEIARGEDPTANIFVSPLSASMALGMALAGAEAGTFEAMREALRLGGLGREAIGVSYRSLMDLLSGLDPAVRLEIGNSVWHREGFALEDAYVSEVERDFLARVEALDFNDPGAADLINAWVSEATDDLIEGIVDPPIDPLTMAFLINAIYFEGAWTLQFDPERTASGDFRRPDGSTVSVLFMSMSDDGIQAFVESLDAEAWAEIIAGLHETELLVALPKFTLEYDNNLNDVLKALGMEAAFDPAAADFSRMHRDALAMQLHISRVKQKAFVDVDEEGTRAAAVTSVEIGVTSAPPMFRADRPFLFAIRERLSGALLFTGVVKDPTAG